MSALPMSPMLSYARRHGLVGLDDVTSTGGVTGVDDATWPKFAQAAKDLGINAFDWAKVLFAESSFTPSAVNKNANGSIVAVGINQFSTVGSNGYVGGPGNTFAMMVPETTAADYATWPASRQVDKTIQFFRGLLRAHPTAKTAAELYWLNFMPATYVPNAPPEYVITRDPKMIAANPNLRLPGEGDAIRLAGLQRFLDTRTAGSSRWAAIAKNLQSLGATVDTGPAVVANIAKASPWYSAASIVFVSAGVWVLWQSLSPAKKKRK